MTTKSKKVRCLVCNEILTYDNDNTSVLVDHLNLEHSGLDVFRFLAHCQVSNSGIDHRDSDNLKSSKDNLKPETIGDNLSDAKQKTPPKITKITSKNTVDSWTPGPNNLTCPKCGKEGLPLVKKQKNKIAKSPLGALCMLGCWPFCFLPFLFRREQFLEVYCSSCKYFFGTYDKRRRCMVRPPNSGEMRVEEK